MPRQGWSLRFAASALCSLAMSCGGGEPGEETLRLLEGTAPLQAVPARGSASSLDIASWNIEWFGDTGNGPSNENLQLQNARDVIGGSDFDIWGLVEIVSTSQLNNLRSQLSGYATVLANDSIVRNGSSFYAASEQKPALLYKTSVASIVSAKIILTQFDSEFAGRPPLEVRLNVTLNGSTDELIVIVMHAKASSDTASWQRRQAAAVALKSYLDTTYPTSKVAVIGDFNDDLDTSITSGKASPYANFSSDSNDYRFPSRELTNAGIATTTGFPDAVDHHLNTNEFYARYTVGSVDAYRVDEFIANYASTTSDHYPVYSQYTWGGGGSGGGGTGGSSGGSGGSSGGGSGGGGSGRVVINEILANETGSDTAGEAVEVVNIGTASINLAGYTLRDSSSVRHTFASGTQLAAGKALVVFGSAGAIPAGLANAVGASTGTLGLGNGGDTVSLRDAASSTVDSFSYSASLSGTDGVSMNRSSDGGMGSFVLHTTLSSLKASPGRRSTGASF